MFSKPQSSGYKFNSFKEIKSHSSVLYNERLAILWYILDMDSMALNSNPNKVTMLKTKGTLYQIWKNVRCIIRSNHHCRKVLHLETKDPGVYTVDAAFFLVDKWILHCDTFNKKTPNKNNWTHRNLYIIIQHLNNIEVIIRDILQYFQYFIRADFRQMPDILQAAEDYKKYADKLTIQQLRDVVGEKNELDFNSLGIVSDEDYREQSAVTDDDEEISDAEEEMGRE